MVNRKHLAKIITELRAKKGYSQRKLAMVSGVSNSTISRIESAASGTDPETLRKIAPCLDVTYEELMYIAGYIDSNNDNENSIADIAYPSQQEDVSLIKEEGFNYTSYPDVHDVEEAMKIILEQPGLMLKGEILSDESKIILANAIQMGLRTAEELEKKKNKGDTDE